MSEFDGVIDDIMMELDQVYDLYTDDLMMKTNAASGDQVIFFLDDRSGNSDKYGRQDAITDMIYDTFEDAGWSTHELEVHFTWDVVSGAYERIHFWLP